MTTPSCCRLSTRAPSRAAHSSFALLPAASASCSTYDFHTPILAATVARGLSAFIREGKN